MANDSGEFTPSSASGTDLNATTLTGSSSIPGSGNVLRMVNLGSSVVRVRITDGSSTAALGTDAALLVNVVEMFGCGDTPYVSAITASGTATVNISRGYGK